MNDTMSNNNRITRRAALAAGAALPPFRLLPAGQAGNSRSAARPPFRQRQTSVIRLALPPAAVVLMEVDTSSTSQSRR